MNAATAFRGTGNDGAAVRDHRGQLGRARGSRWLLLGLVMLAATVAAILTLGPGLGGSPPSGSAGTDTPGTPPGSTVASPPEHIVGLGFEDVVASPAKLRRLAGELDAVNATGVSVSVGRLDWTAFPWPAHRDDWAAQVREENDADLVAELIDQVGTDPRTGRPRQLILVIDALLVRWIAEDPSIAGVDANGEPSKDLASLAQFESGPVGERLDDLVAEVAKRYRPDAISLTELFNDTHTFGEDDLLSFQASTGLADWPRAASGEIDEQDPAIARWRSEVVAAVVARARAAASAEDVELWMEVRVNWADPQGDRPESGHNYGLLLDAADRLVLWNYFGLEGPGADQSLALARAANARAPGRFVMSVGLWANDDETISAEQLTAATRASVEGGVNSLWITPASLMTASHWSALGQVWED